MPNYNRDFAALATTLIGVVRIPMGAEALEISVTYPGNWLERSSENAVDLTPPRDIRAYIAEQEFERLKKEIRKFGELPSNWDSFGSEPISEQAVQNALEALGKMYARNLSPNRVDPSSDESIIFELQRNNKTLLFEFFSDGEIAALRKEGTEKTAFDLSASELDQFIGDAVDPVCPSSRIPDHLHTLDKSLDEQFNPTETLYRRFEHGTEGTRPSPSIFTTRKMSLARAKYCGSKTDALYNCDSDQHYFSWAIAEFSVSDIEKICLKHPTKVTEFTFKLVHRPEQCWYPHSEVWIFADGARTEKFPGSLKMWIKDHWADSCRVIKSSDPPESSVFPTS